MAKLEITIVALPVNTGVTQVAGMSLATIATDGGQIKSSNTQKMLLRVSNTAAGPKNITIVAGVNPPSVRAAGDLVIAVTNATTAYIVLESARFVQADGYIYVNAEAATTGDCQAYRLTGV